ncbi:MAG: ATP-binding cassette domain-containing protein [Bacilli bacterium]
MLKLDNITKVYEVGEMKQVALNGVSLSFRKNEFASILGPSGSGKTTLLNIIGGLDKYTSGDLIINNVSTKEYKDSDWDSYRNHKIGFVFQSYNLISHQTVLQNVVLALTLSGISKKEGIERAKQALIDVGLEDHIYKRPNQLSGGQMQRVAIARALVNDPDILLADEPTGALDSETSVQIMKLLKDISKNKLVIMVTHNPSLAEKYSNRIINLIDGKIISDTNPYKKKKEKETSGYIKTKKTFMSFMTALSLSFNNLMTKKGRTILVSVAGSIGIIGIALIMSLSNGFQNYIDKIQEETLSSYPLTITSETADMTSMLLSMVSGDSTNDNTNKVVEKQYVTSMFSNIATNDLRSFKYHLEQNEDKIKDDVSSIKYSYSIDPTIYTKEKNGDITKVNPNTLFTSMFSSNIMSSYSNYSSIFSQMTDDIDALNEQFDVLAGSWPEKYDELVIVLSEPNAIPDLLVYFLGLRDMDELTDTITKLMSGEEVNLNNEPLELTYDELMDIELKLIHPSNLYKYNSKYEIYEDMSEDIDYVKKLYDKATRLKIVGVVAPKKGSTSMTLTQGVAYTKDLIDYIIEEAKKSEIVKKQLDNKDIDVFSNLRFDEEKEKDTLNFEDMISVDEDMLKSAFNINIDSKSLENKTKSYMQNIQNSITTNTNPAYENLKLTLETLAKNMLNNYIENPKETFTNPLDPSIILPVIHINIVDNYVSEYMSSDDATKLIKSLESKYVIPSSVYNETFSAMLSSMIKGYITSYNEMDSSQTTDGDNMGALITSESVDIIVSNFMSQAIVLGVLENLSSKMTEAVMQKTILTDVGNLTQEIINSFSNAFDVDPNKISKAFKFDLSESELRRIMEAMMNTEEKNTQKSNLIKLGYQDKDDPTSISVYFKSFDSKENFVDFIDEYNDNATKNNEEDKVLRYTDITGILMGSVKKVINSVSYVLIAFVSISLVVSSIMIGIITYISVFERTKEIGILRAIGASKRNISSIFNAETFIIGLLSGLFGVGVTLSLIPIINLIIHSATGNYNINASLPLVGGIILIILSVILTLIGGIIPSKAASKKDPVIALRTE